MAVEILPLTKDLTDQYHTDGFLLASGLIPEAIARMGEATMWEVMGMDANDPETWDLFGNMGQLFGRSACFDSSGGIQTQIEIVPVLRQPTPRPPRLLYARNDGHAMAQLTGEKCGLLFRPRISFIHQTARSYKTSFPQMKNGRGEEHILTVV